MIKITGRSDDIIDISGDIEEAHRVVQRALRRRSRLVAFTLRDAYGETLWDRTILVPPK